MASAVVAVRSALDAQFGPDVRVVTKTTDDLEANLPQVRVIGAGGTQVKNLAAERILIETFHSDENSATLLAVQINDFLALTLRGVIEGAVISRIRVDGVPFTTSYTNPNVSQQLGRYTVFHRPAY